MTDRLVIRRPDDWHVHLRDGAMLDAVAPYTARQFARAIIMPNLVPPASSVAAVRAYAERIRKAAGPDFEPLMTCYLVDGISPDEIERGGWFSPAEVDHWLAERPAEIAPALALLWPRVRATR